VRDGMQENNKNKNLPLAPFLNIDKKFIIKVSSVIEK